MELDAQTQARRLDHGALWLMSDILLCKKAKILWHPSNWQNTSKKKRIQSEHNGPESWPEWQSTSLSLKIWNWTELLQHKLYMRLFTSAPEIPALDPTTGQSQSDAPGTQPRIMVSILPLTLRRVFSIVSILKCDFYRVHRLFYQNCVSNKT